MARRSTTSCIATTLVAMGGLLTTRAALAQAAETKAPPAAGEGKPAVIERAPLVLRPSEKFQIPLHLDATKSINLAARRDGAVASVLVKLGDKVQPQAEAVRLDTQERQLELKRAQAAHKAAVAEQGKSPPNDEGALARVDVAKADLELAQLRLDQCNVHTPIGGVVVKVHVVDGEFVTAGQPLVTVIDGTQLRVEVPVDAKAIAVGNSVPLKVEDESVNGTLQAIVPLSDRFEPLRDLFLSVASGIVIVDNAGGKMRAGQTVYSSLIPRQPVTEVPSTSLSNTGDGGRKVQIIRDGLVRDIKVELLGQVGEDHVFVSGRFGPTDEIVLKSSEPLLDGARVVAQSQAGAAAAPKGNAPPAKGPTF
jgi:multidrug efflux pump subunit AcrA (membrane-fusion protein)